MDDYKKSIYQRNNNSLCEKINLEKKDKMKKIIFVLISIFFIIGVSGCQGIYVPTQGSAPLGFRYDNNAEVPLRKIHEDDFGYMGFNVSLTDRNAMSVALNMDSFDIYLLRHYKNYYYSICQLDDSSNERIFELCFFDENGDWICNYTLTKLYYFSDFIFEKNKTSVETLKMISPYNVYPAEEYTDGTFNFIQFIDKEVMFTLGLKNNEFVIVDYEECEDAFLLSEHLIPKDLELIK